MKCIPQRQFAGDGSWSVTKAKQVCSFNTKCIGVMEVTCGNYKDFTLCLDGIYEDRVFRESELCTYAIYKKAEKYGKQEAENMYITKYYHNYTISYNL